VKATDFGALDKGDQNAFDPSLAGADQGRDGGRSSRSKLTEMSDALNRLNFDHPDAASQFIQAGESPNSLNCAKRRSGSMEDGGRQVDPISPSVRCNSRFGM
jgi:hypothetical protein